MTEWDTLADTTSLEKTKKSLEAHGMKVVVAENGKEAFTQVMARIPEKSEVFDATSVTLDMIGVSKELQESGKFTSVRKKIIALEDKEGRDSMRKHSAAAEYIVGSVHAVTEDGKVVIASNTGSQLSGYAYGAKNLIWVVGTQKIVKNLDEAFKRIYEYALPLEDERAQKAYGVHSGVNKILIIEKEVAPERITVVFVKEKLGF